MTTPSLSPDPDPGGGSARWWWLLAAPAVCAATILFAQTAMASEGASAAAADEGISFAEIAIFAVLLLLSSLFSGAESALTAVSSLRIRTMAEGGNRTSKLVERLIADRSRLISALLIGNNIVNAALTTFATVVFTASFSDLGPGMAATAAAAVSVIFLLIFGEVIPKTLGVNMPVGFSHFVAWPVWVVRQVMWPLTILLSGLQRLTLRLFRHDADQSARVSGADIQALARLAEGQDVLAEGAGDAIAKMVSLHETNVREVLTPRIDVVGVPTSASYEDVIQAFKSHRFSRLPVYEGDIDGVVGVITIRDMLGLSPEQIQEFSAGRGCRRAVFVPELKRANELILEMRRDRFHFAIVVDEYGGTAGIVTLEDLLESVVGQIEDEFDEGSPRIRRIGSGVLLVDGGVTISELEHSLRFRLPEVQGVDTVAGLFLAQSEKIPTEGESIAFDKVVLEVRKMRGQRIVRVLVRAPSSGRLSSAP